MAEDNRKFILKILEDLRSDEMKKLEFILNSKEIPANKLQNLDANKAEVLFTTNFDKPLEKLKCCLVEIPRKDLIQKISAKIEADMKNKVEAQNTEKFALIKSYPGSSDRPPYTGKYTIFDLEDYATENQDQLVMHLENILEPAEFNALKKKLMSSEMNTFFPFTAQKYYELFRNIHLKEFLKNINGQSKKIPMKLFNIMFSEKKKTHKRKLQEPIQREGNINLKKKQFVTMSDDYNNIPDKVTPKIENEKITRIHSIEHKPVNEDSDVVEENCLDKDSRMAIEHKPGNEDSDVVEENCLDKDSRMAIEHKPGNEDSDVVEENCLDKDSRMAIEHKPGNEDSDVVEENCLDKDSRMAIEHKPSNEDSDEVEENCPDKDLRMAIAKWNEKNNNNYKERMSKKYICSREHQAYPCFIAEDVFQIKLPDDPDYRILAIQNKRDFTKSQKLTKEAEFVLQFNMAVLDVQSSVVISSNGFLCEIRANGSFAESEIFLKNIVFEIVLPVLALYKWVKLNAFENALNPNKESK